MVNLVSVRTATDPASAAEVVDTCLDFLSVDRPCGGLVAFAPSTSVRLDGTYEASVRKPVVVAGATSSSEIWTVTSVHGT